MRYTPRVMPVALSRVDRSLQYSRFIGLSVCALAGIVLLGWVLSIEILIQPIPTIASMKANTALLLVVEGLALALIVSGSLDRRVGRGVAALGAIVAFLTLSQDVLQVNFGIDEALFDDVTDVTSRSPGRMAPATALSLLLLGIAMAARPSSRAQIPVQAAALLAVTVTMLAIVGYLLDVRAFYGFGAYTTMAVHTAVLLFVLAVGVLASQPSVGIARLLLGEGPASVMARHWLPVAIIAPAAASVLVSWGQAELGYSPATSLALLTVFTSALLGIVIAITAIALRQLEGARADAEDQFNVLSATLERRVQERGRHQS